MVRMMGVKGYEQFTFETYRQNARNRAGLEACKAFDPKVGSLYLHGPVGCGKSHLAWSMARAIPGAEVNKATALIRWFRMRDPREEEREIDRLARVPCLVVDDLGVQKDSEHALSILYEILDRRDMDCRFGLIITSNLPLDDLARKMGDDRITSRIAGMCKIVKLDGPDGRVSK
jgi:DNA replication protein DnaC